MLRKVTGVATKATGQAGLRGRANSIGELISVFDDNKRKRTPEENDTVASLRDQIKQLIEGVFELSRTIATSTNVRKDVVKCASKLDTMARRLNAQPLDDLIQNLEDQRQPKTPKVQGACRCISIDEAERRALVAPKASTPRMMCEIGTQAGAEVKEWGIQTAPSMCDASTQTVPELRDVVAKKPPRFTFTKVKEGNPLTLDTEWDLAVVRSKEDLQMEQGIQRLFRNRYGEIVVPEGEVAHIKTATWVMGKDDEPLITRTIYRVDGGDNETIGERLKMVFQRMATAGRNKLAMAWDDRSKVDKLREDVEGIAAQHEITLAIHVKPDGKTKPPVRKPDTEAILVKRAVGATYANTLRSVRDEVMEKGLGDSIRGVRETRTGHRSQANCRTKWSANNPGSAEQAGEGQGEGYQKEAGGGSPHQGN